MLEGHDPGAFEDHQKHRREKGDPEAKQKARGEVEIIADRRKRFLLDPADIALEPQQKFERPRHRNEISKARAGREKHRGRQQERQERAFLLGIEPRRDKPPDLGRKHREGDHQRREKSDLHLDEEGLEDVRVDQLALPGGEQRLDEYGEDFLGEIEAYDKADQKRPDAPQQASAKLDQMVEQRRFAVIEVAHHGNGRSAGGAGSSSGAADASNGSGGWSSDSGGSAVMRGCWESAGTGSG